MLFGKAAVHGVYMLCYLSKQRTSRATSAAALAQAVNAPAEHARKILIKLSAAGLVQSVPGRTGGYAQTRQLEDISVLEVLEAVGSFHDEQGPSPRRCAADLNQLCSIQNGLIQLHGRLQNTLANTTLASLAPEQA